jgi:hypothetical protein
MQCTGEEFKNSSIVKEVAAMYDSGQITSATTKPKENRRMSVRTGEFSVRQLQNSFAGKHLVESDVMENSSGDCSCKNDSLDVEEIEHTVSCGKESDDSAIAQISVSKSAAEMMNVHEYSYHMGDYLKEAVTVENVCKAIDIIDLSMNGKKHITKSQPVSLPPLIKLLLQQHSLATADDTLSMLHDILQTESKANPSSDFSAIVNDELRQAAEEVCVASTKLFGPQQYL